MIFDMRRRGFTLTELLIVIAIIAILAGLLMPALTMVKREANTLKCSSNMRQIAMAIEVYRQNADNTCPGSFQELVQLYQLPPKLLLCPFDKDRGSNPLMGRAVAWNPPYNRLYQPGSSYDFESSGSDSDLICTQADINFFYRDVPQAQRPALGTVSWADCKHNEQLNGNVDGSLNPGQPFPTSVVPVIRCYFHNDWDYAAAHFVSDVTYPNKVNNIMLDFNRDWSIPYWEEQYNPNIAQGHFFP